MPPKAKLSESPVPGVAVKKKEVLVADFSVGDTWVDGGVQWEIVAVVEDGALSSLNLVGVTVGDLKPVSDGTDMAQYKLKAILKRLYENNGKV